MSKYRISKYRMYRNAEYVKIQNIKPGICQNTKYRKIPHVSKYRICQNIEYVYICITALLLSQPTLIFSFLN